MILLFELLLLRLWVYIHDYCYSKCLDDVELTMILKQQLPVHQQI